MQVVTYLILSVVGLAPLAKGTVMVKRPLSKDAAALDKSNLLSIFQPKLNDRLAIPR